MFPKRASITLFVLVISSTGSLLAQNLHDPFWWLNSPNRFDMVLLIMKSQKMEYDQEQRKIAAQAEVRAVQLRKKTAELLAAVRLLSDQIGDSKVASAETPRLARRCENLSKEIKKLLRRPR